MHTVCMKCMRWLSAIGLLLAAAVAMASDMPFRVGDRKSTRLNSSH